MQPQKTEMLSVNDEFRQMMLEFTVTYLLEEPDDLILFAADYFKKLKATEIELKEDKKQLTQPHSSADSVSEETELQLGIFTQYKRHSVSAEDYDPENDTDPAPENYPKTPFERKALREAYEKIFFLKSLDSDQCEEVINAMSAKEVRSGDEIIREGDDGDFFYVIDRGIYNVYQNINGKENKVNSYHNSGSFGELALLYNQPRAATIRAASDGKLWAMSRCKFRKIILQRAYKKRKHYENLISSIPMLDSLTICERLSLADALIERKFSNGEIIIKQGDIGDGMYFIESGEVRVCVLNDDEEEIEIKHLSDGDYFGELALLTHNPRSASVYAIGDVKLAFMAAEVFKRLLGPCMQILKRNIPTYKKM